MILLYSKSFLNPHRDILYYSFYRGFNVKVEKEQYTRGQGEKALKSGK